jgi:hypothetical protein
MGKLFRKVIARPGKYLVRTLSGERAVQNFTKSKLAKMAKTGTDMLKEGMLIPAPYGHSDGKKVVPVPLLKDPEDPNIFLDADTGKPSRWDHALNAGFWRKFETDETGALVGYVEAEGDEKDEKTHAGRVGKMFQNVSPVVHGQWIDGKGNLREDALLHVCLTNKPVDFGQDNFKAMPDEPNYSIAMALYEDDIYAMSDDEPGDQKDPKKVSSNASQTDAPEANPATDAEDALPNPALGPEVINKIKLELKTKLKVTLPDDTNETNFLDRLLTILTNLEAEEEEESEFDVEPEDGKPPRTPTIMSLDAEVLTKKNTGLLTVITDQRKKSYKERVEALVASGRVGRAHAEAAFLPTIEAFAMSVDDVGEDGTFAPNAIEMSLDLLEKNEALTEPTKDGQQPKDGKVPNKPADMQDAPVDEVSEALVNETLDSLMPPSIYPYAPTL